MRYRYLKPHQELSPYVRTVLTVEGSSVQVEGGQPLFTNGMPALLCRTRKSERTEETARLSLFGKSTTPDAVLAGEGETVVAYFFKPFALASFFNVSAVKLADVPIDLSEWNPHQANAIRVQMALAESTDRKVEILDHLLLHQLERNRRTCEIIQQATDYLMHDSGKDVLSEMLIKLDISERSLQRLFRKYVGVSPNHYRRICQFQDSFSQLRRQKFDKLTDVAFDNGFADQSHFIRSFREFADTTPKEYLQSGLMKKKK